MGDENDNYSEPGDIIITFNEKTDNSMFRNGDNLEITIPILLSEALLGFSIPYNHPNGKKIIIKSSDIITPGTKHKIEELGFKSGHTQGDLIINFDIIFPKSLDSKRMELVGKLLPKRKSNNLQGLKSYKISPYEEDINAEATYHEMPSHTQEDGPPECRTS